MSRLGYLLFTVLFAGCSEHSSVKKEHQLKSLQDRKEYFRLRTALKDANDLIAIEKKIYFRAFVENAFNQNQKSIEDAGELLSQKASDIADSDRVGLLKMQSDNYFKTFQYAKAAKTDSMLLNQYKDQLDSAQVEDIKNYQIIYRALYNIPAQEVEMKSNTTISWTRDKIGLMEIPVKCGDSTISAIFDTGAGITSISNNYAKRLGIHVLDVSYEEGSGITGIKFKTGLGVADSLYIGNILIKNVIFQVMPDEVLYIAPIQFSLNLIIGYPVIAALKEIHIEQEGKMTIPLHPTKKDLNDLAMDELKPVISVQIGKDTLCFHFDTGANTSDFYSTFYEKFRTGIMKDAKPQSIQSGGAGGVVNVSIYNLDSLNLRVSGSQAIMKNVSVHMNAIPGNEREKFYGNLGQDLLKPFKEVILNFEDMYIELRN